MLASNSLEKTIQPPRKSLRVLYADDMKELRQLLEIVLDRDGHKVDTVADGTHAIDLVKKHPGKYDVVITDHHMPSMTGLQLVSHLRALSYPGKIIVFSSEISEEIDESYRAQKVDFMLPKPVFPTDIRAIFATLSA
jgi:two-component system chemotaxis response regulator CheY